MCPSQAKIVIVEDEKQMEKFRQVPANCLMSVVAFVAYVPGQPVPAPVGKAQSFDWIGFLAAGALTDLADVDAKSKAVVAGRPPV